MRPKGTGAAQDKSCSPSSKPLRGKCIYIDVPNSFSKPALRKLINDFTLLGACVEDFFSQDVKYLVTAYGSPDTFKATKNAAACSSSPSPFSCAAGVTDSPGGTTDSQKSPVPGTSDSQTWRGRAMLAKSHQLSGTGRLIEMAMQWQIKIVHITDAQKWIEKEKRNLTTGTAFFTGKASDSQARTPKQKLLSPPFVKLEDAGRRCRPVYQMIDSWPSLNFDASDGTSPFNNVPTSKERGKGKKQSKEAGNSKRAPGDSGCATPNVFKCPASRSRQQATRSAAKATKIGDDGKMCEKNAWETESKKPGYCECCKTKYEDLKEHLDGVQHRNFATNKANYTALDLLIAGGPNMDQFLEDVLKYHEAHSSQETTDICRQEENGSAPLSQCTGNQPALSDRESVPASDEDMCIVMPESCGIPNGGKFVVLKEKRKRIQPNRASVASKTKRVRSLLPESKGSNVCSLEADSEQRPTVAPSGDSSRASTLAMPCAPGRIMPASTASTAVDGDAATLGVPRLTELTSFHNEEIHNLDSLPSDHHGDHADGEGNAQNVCYSTIEVIEAHLRDQGDGVVQDVQTHCREWRRHDVNLSACQLPASDINPKEHFTIDDSLAVFAEPACQAMPDLCQSNKKAIKKKSNDQAKRLQRLKLKEHWKALNSSRFCRSLSEGDVPLSYYESCSDFPTDVSYEDASEIDVIVESSAYSWVFCQQKKELKEVKKELSSICNSVRILTCESDSFLDEYESFLSKRVTTMKQQKNHMLLTPVPRKRSRLSISSQYNPLPVDNTSRKAYLHRCRVLNGIRSRSCFDATSKSAGIGNVDLPAIQGTDTPATNKRTFSCSDSEANNSLSSKTCHEMGREQSENFATASAVRHAGLEAFSVIQPSIVENRLSCQPIIDVGKLPSHVALGLAEPAGSPDKLPATKEHSPVIRSPPAQNSLPSVDPEPSAESQSLGTGLAIPYGYAGFPQLSQELSMLSASENTYPIKPCLTHELQPSLGHMQASLISDSSCHAVSRLPAIKQAILPESQSTAAEVSELPTESCPLVPSGQSLVHHVAGTEQACSPLFVRDEPSSVEHLLATQRGCIALCMGKHFSPEVSASSADLQYWCGGACTPGSSCHIEPLTESSCHPATFFHCDKPLSTNEALVDCELHVQSAIPCTLLDGRSLEITDERLPSTASAGIQPHDVDTLQQDEISMADQCGSLASKVLSIDANRTASTGPSGQQAVCSLDTDEDAHALASAMPAGNLLVADSAVQPIEMSRTSGLLDESCQCQESSSINAPVEEKLFSTDGTNSIADQSDSVCALSEMQVHGSISECVGGCNFEAGIAGNLQESEKANGSQPCTAIESIAAFPRDHSKQRCLSVEVNVALQRKFVSCHGISGLSPKTQGRKIFKCNGRLPKHFNLGSILTSFPKKKSAVPAHRLKQLLSAGEELSADPSCAGISMSPRLKQPVAQSSCCAVPTCVREGHHCASLSNCQEPGASSLLSDKVQKYPIASQAGITCHSSVNVTSCRQSGDFLACSCSQIMECGHAEQANSCAEPQRNATRSACVHNMFHKTESLSGTECHQSKIFSQGHRSVTTQETEVLPGRGDFIVKDPAPASSSLQLHRSPQKRYWDGSILPSAGHKNSSSTSEPLGISKALELLACRLQAVSPSAEKRIVSSRDVSSVSYSTPSLPSDNDFEGSISCYVNKTPKKSLASTRTIECMNDFQPAVARASNHSVKAGDISFSRTPKSAKRYLYAKISQTASMKSTKCSPVKATSLPCRASGALSLLSAEKDVSLPQRLHPQSTGVQDSGSLSSKEAGSSMPSNLISQKLKEMQYDFAADDGDPYFPNF